MKPDAIAILERCDDGSTRGALERIISIFRDGLLPPSMGGRARYDLEVEAAEELAELVALKRACDPGTLKMYPMTVEGAPGYWISAVYVEYLSSLREGGPSEQITLQPGSVVAPHGFDRFVAAALRLRGAAQDPAHFCAPDPDKVREFDVAYLNLEMRDLTDAEAQRLYEEATPRPYSDAEVERMVRRTVDESPTTAPRDRGTEGEK